MEQNNRTLGDSRDNSRSNSPLEVYDGVCSLEDEGPVPEESDVSGNDYHPNASISDEKRDSIMTKIANAEDEVKSTAKEKNKSVAGFFTIFRLANCADRLLVTVGVLVAILHGTAMPITLRVFSEAIDLFVADAITRSQDMLEFSRNASIATDVEDITSTIRPLCIRLTYWAVIIVVAGNVHMFCWKLASERLVSRLRSQLFSAILYQDCAWFDGHDTGSLVVTLTNDIVNIESGMSDKVALFIQHMSVFIVAIIMALAASWRLALAVLAVTPISVLAILAMVIVTRKATATQTKAYAKAGSIATEILAAIRTVAAFGGELKESLRYQQCLFSARKVGIIKGFLTGCAMGLVRFGNFSMFGIAIWYGTSLIGTDTTGSSVIFVLMVMITGAMSLGHSLPNLDGIATAGGSAIAIFEIIDNEPTICSRSEEGLKPERLLGNIEFDRVNFVYESRPEVKVLDEVSVKMAAGQTVALVGASGSGKSTLGHLLLRLYDCTAGQVILDGHDVKDINVRWLRQQIGVVSQNPVLFAGSISDNIKLGHERATRAELEEAAKIANAHNFIMQFPDKYDTLVGERGTQLSGGQKQRIAIARALISSPRILLLDEATSSLDSESEALVQDALDKASEGRTTIVIAHRLSTVRTADVIHCLKDGRVVESGSHDNLMRMAGSYYELVVSQQTKTKSTEDNETGTVIMDQSVPRDFKDYTIEIMEKLDNANGEDDQFDIITEETQLEKTQKSVFVRLMKLNVSEWPYLVVGCIAAFCAGSAGPLFAVVYSVMMKNFAVVDRDEQMSQAWVISVSVFGVAFLLGIIHCIQQVMFAIVGENLTMRLRRIVFACMLRQEIGWFDQPENKTGVLTSRLAVDATIVRGVGGTQLGNVFLAASSVLVSLLVAFIASWKLSLVILLFIPFLVTAGVVYGRNIQGSAHRSMREAEDGGEIASEAISNIRTVAALTIEDTFMQKFDKFFDSGMRKKGQEAVKVGLFHGFSQSIPHFCYATAFFYGAHLISRGEIEFQDIFMVVLALISTSFMIGRSTSFAPDANKARVAANHIFDLLDRKPESSAGCEGKCLTECRGEVTLSAVKFTYPSRPDAAVLRGLTVTIKPGQRVALVGQSGCGKSTCMSLVERFYDVTNGSVLVDGVDVRSLDVQWLRAQLALVTQEPVLFNTTIYDNITYGDNTRTATMDEVIDVAKKANIHNFIASLPLGYDTNVGECGSQLSGGQKQRIAIARALLRNPRILLLDEATSALDSESEQLVQEALERAQEGRTCIVIAHRLSTIRSADKIVVIQDGLVVEEGTHDELMAQKSFYHRLVQKQIAA